MKGRPRKSPVTVIGRKRLPRGIVAILDDVEALRAAIRDLHRYANDNHDPKRPRQGIVFRVVEDWEAEAIRHKLADFFGPKRIRGNDEVYSVPVGHLHLMDDSLMSHACNRHAIAEGGNAHLVLTVDDFELIPEVVNPRYIREFSVTKGMPRIVYEREYSEAILVVVEELQEKAGLAVKTAYKKMKK